MSAVDVVVIGAGLRGSEVYGRYAAAHPDRMRVVGLAEPDPERREAMAREHQLAVDATFADWQSLLTGPRRAAAAIVATSDTEHVGPALRAIEACYSLLLEKRMAPDPRDCIRIVDAAESADSLLQIGHVLRHTPFYVRLHELIAAGAIVLPLATGVGNLRPELAHELPPPP